MKGKETGSNDSTSPEFYKELRDHMSDGVYLIERDRRITYWNKDAAKLTGYAPEEIVGRYCHDDILCQMSCPLRLVVSESSRV